MGEEDIFSPRRNTRLKNPLGLILHINFLIYILKWLRWDFLFYEVYAKKKIEFFVSVLYLLIMSINKQYINNNNFDIRCGLLASVRVNTNYILHIRKEFREYDENPSEELCFVGNPKYEEKMWENFWSEYNQRVCVVIENPHKYKEDCGGGMEYELVYRLEELVEDWKDSFEWIQESESDIEDCKNIVVDSQATNYDMYTEDEDEDKPIEEQLVNLNMN